MINRGSYRQDLFINDGARETFERCLFEAFEKMCYGWAFGTKDFKRKSLETEGLLKDGNTQAIRLEGKELQEANELQWEAILNRRLKILGKDIADITNDRKSASWKVWIASVLKQRSSATNVWIARQLNMGVPQAVTIHVGSLDKVKLRKTKEYQNFIYEFTKWPLYFHSDLRGFDDDQG